MKIDQRLWRMQTFAACFSNKVAPLDTHLREKFAHSQEGTIVPIR